VIRNPAGWPLAVLAVMESKNLILVNFDTGTRHNLLFLSPNESWQGLKDVAIKGDEYSVDKAEFVGDDRRRGNIELRFGETVLSVPVAIVQFQKNVIGPRITLGTNFMLGRRIGMNFSNSTLQISRSSVDEGLLTVGSNITPLRVDRGRLLVTIDEVNYVLDMGVAFADIVDFTSLHRIDADKRGNYVEMSGPVGGLLCAPPSALKLQIGLLGVFPLHSTCAFLTESDYYPQFKILGLRSIIDGGMNVVLDYPDPRRGLGVPEIGRSN
jgi:hypothetical protein